MNAERHQLRDTGLEDQLRAAAKVWRVEASDLREQIGNLAPHAEVMRERMEAVAQCYVECAETLERILDG